MSSDAVAKSPMEGRSLVTRESLKRELRELGVKEGMTLLVHSSLKSLGWVCGGAQVVIEAMQDVLTVEGTLILPTHSTDLTDPGGWCNPPVPDSWVEPVRESLPAFDPCRTVTRCMGAIPELFRSYPDVLRSYHPHHSFAAWGRHAEFVTNDHRLKSSMGEHSPLARLYDLEGYVLLLGVGYDSNSSFHLSEYRVPTPLVGKTGAPVFVEGKRQWVWYEDLELLESDDYFVPCGKAMEEVMEVKQGKLGDADSKLFAQKPAVDFATDWLAQLDVYNQAKA